MTDESDDSKVSAIGMATSEHMVLIVNNEREACKHLKFWVDAKTRTVTCKWCGALVDSFDAIMVMACNHHRLNERRKFLEVSVRELEQKKQLYETMVQRVKQAARRAGVPISMLNHWKQEELAKWLGMDEELFKRFVRYDEQSGEAQKRRAAMHLVKGQRKHQPHPPPIVYK